MDKPNRPIGLDVQDWGEFRRKLSSFLRNRWAGTPTTEMADFLSEEHAALLNWVYALNVPPEWTELSPPSLEVRQFKLFRAVIFGSAIGLGIAGGVTLLTMWWGL